MGGGQTGEISNPVVWTLEISDGLFWHMCSGERNSQIVLHS